jgi:hypothetical protein
MGKSSFFGVKQISGGTQIIFTVKSFFALIGAMLGLFYGFYQIVVVPKVNATESHYETMYKDQRDQNKIFYEELGKINTSIGALGASIDALNRANDNQAHANANNNSGGSLGGGNLTGSLGNH